MVKLEMFIIFYLNPQLSKSLTIGHFKIGNTLWICNIELQYLLLINCYNYIELDTRISVRFLPCAVVSSLVYYIVIALILSTMFLIKCTLNC